MASTWDDFQRQFAELKEHILEELYQWKANLENDWVMDGLDEIKIKRKKNVCSISLVKQVSVCVYN